MWKKIKAIFKLIGAGSYDEMLESVLPVILSNDAVEEWLSKNSKELNYALSIIADALDKALKTFDDTKGLDMLYKCVIVIIDAVNLKVIQYESKK